MTAAPKQDPLETLRVRIEVPRGGLVKWGADGEVDYVSPLPCPFNYGSVPDRLAPDGDPADALVLGPRLARGASLSVRAVAIVRFLDNGQRDDKLVCVPADQVGAPRAIELWRVRAFFALYAAVKGALRRVRGRRGPTRYQGLQAATRVSDTP
ncbi:MAG: inorganic diphosphatase [Oligoflexia bacterium]|nr:inorganic diphosphatase [Oligoflexia bacterium]